MRRAWHLTLLAAVLLAFAPAQAAAQSQRLDLDIAAEHAARGDRLMDEEDYLGAAEAFNDAANSIALADIYLQRGPYLFASATALHIHAEMVGDRDALYRSIGTYRRALEVVSAARAPALRGQIHTNMGSALWSLGERESRDWNLEQSIASYGAALQVLDRTSDGWARALTGLGYTLTEFAERRNNASYADRAVSAHITTLNVFGTVGTFEDWAAAATGHGLALRTLGVLENDMDRLEEAVSVLHDVIRWIDRDEAPSAWANAQTSLGLALETFGERSDNTELLADAVAAHRAALEVLTRETSPLEWSRMQIVLGNALRALGDRQSDIALLEQALAAYNAALQEVTLERAPLYWVRANKGLGNTLLELDARGSSPERLAAAIAAYEAAQEGLFSLQPRADFLEISINLHVALELRREREGGPHPLEDSIAADRAELAELTRENNAFQWALLQLSLGRSLRQVAEDDDNRQYLEEAAVSLRAAMEVFEALFAVPLAEAAADNLQQVEDLLRQQ